MDIRQWPLNRIMQLPDHCFGRRWVVGNSEYLEAAAVRWRLLPSGLPEKFVIWEVHLKLQSDDETNGSFFVSLGDVEPTSSAEFNALERLFSGLTMAGTRPGYMYVSNYTPVDLVNLKYPVDGAGRRFVLEIEQGAATSRVAIQQFVISAIPTEVPDCLLSV